MAQKMSNKCHSICTAAQCFTRLMDISAGELSARFPFFSGVFFYLQEKGKKSKFLIDHRCSFFRAQDLTWRI